MSALGWAAFVVAGAAGAVARHIASRATWGTFAVNVVGSFVLGLVGGLSDAPRLVLGTAFCGAFTTFSTFAVETVGLAGGGRRAPAAAYAFGTLLAALAAAALGLAAGGG